MCGSMADIQSAAAEIRRGKKKKERKIDRYSLTKLCMGDGAQMAIFFASFVRPVFSASRLQQVSDMHSKFAIRLHHVWEYGRHPMSDR